MKKNNNNQILNFQTTLLKRGPQIKKATFTSVWDGGFEIVTNCKVNMKTKEVFDIEISEGTAELVNELDCEYITIDGREYPVYNEKSRKDFWY